MTTIAYKDGAMAADSQATFGDTKLTGYSKLGVGTRSLLGYAGSPRFATSVFAWWRSVERADSPTGWHRFRDEGPEIPDGEMLSLIAMDSGTVWRLYHDFRVAEIIGNFAAIGTGEAFALGAMASGSSALCAVEIAAKFDLFSSPPVHVVRLRT